VTHYSTQNHVCHPTYPRTTLAGKEKTQSQIATISMDSLIPFTTSGSLVDCVDSTSTSPSPLLARAQSSVHMRPQERCSSSYEMAGNFTACCAPMTSSVRPCFFFPSSQTVPNLSLNVSPPPLLGLANLVLEDTVERIYAGNTFAEKWCGLFLIRGENVVLLGEIVHFPLPPPSQLPLAAMIHDYATGSGSRGRCPTTSS